MLDLTGDFCCIFGLLRRLALPEMLDELYLAVFNPTVEDVSKSLAPYMRDYFRRDPRFQDRLGVSSFPSSSTISISLGVVRTQTTGPGLELPLVSLTTFTSPNLLDRFFY